MKTITHLTWFAITAAAASALGVAFDVLPFALFSVALGAYLSLFLAHDYAPRTTRSEPSPRPAVQTVPTIAAATAVQPLRLAA
jgi:hypothetical protein